MHVRNGGIVFHLYPRSRLDGFQEYPVPEITRDSLVDVCLFARLIIPEEMRLPQFFCSLPDGPPTTAVHQAIGILESIDAFDSHNKVMLNAISEALVYDKYFFLPNLGNGCRVAPH